MRAAAVQLTATEDTARNLATAERLVREAASAGADFVVLPEKWTVLGSEAAAIGLVNRALPDGEVLAEALRYGRMLAEESSPSSMATMKAQVYGDYSRELGDALAEANRLMFESFTAPDLAEGVQSFLERRPPKFAALSTRLPVG